MRNLRALPLLLLVAGLPALRAAAALPAPAYAATGVAVAEELPTLAYAGAGTLRNGLYTSVYDDFGESFHGLWPLDGHWNNAEMPPWRSANAFRTNWKPSITRREVAIHTPVDLRTAYRCEWEIRPGRAALSVPVGVACSPAQEEPQDPLGRALPAAEGRAAPGSDAPAATATTPLPAHLGEAAQLLRQPAPGGHSRRRRQVSLVGRRGASSSAAAAAASASSGPWGSSAAAAAASAAAASGGRRRPGYGYGYRPGYYGRQPAYGRPYPGSFYG